MSNRFSHLLFPRLAVMVRYSNLVKQAVQLANYCIDLLGQVAGIHVGGTVCSSGRNVVAQKVGSTGPTAEKPFVSRCDELSVEHQIGCGGVSPECNDVQQCS
jgi:hypothetical protein